MNESTLVPREEMSSLDWLARNVHEWAEDWTHVRKCPVHHEAKWMASLSPNAEYKDWRTKQQWFARRAELQNKPSWGDLPDWAMWISQDSDGNWWMYETEPKSILDMRGTSHWSCSDGSCESLLRFSGEVIGDHLDTLEKRPEQAEFKPFVSVEDAKITIMQSDGDVKHFGGIIGRSLPLEEDAATAKQPTPKGIGKPILGMVLADLTNRALEGKEKYGEPLLAHNGRNPLWDAYQEALDLAMYLRQAIEEQKK